LELNENELRLLELCSEAKPIAELMAALGWKNRTKFRNRYVSPLINQELLGMTIPDKPKSRLQKYRTSQLGKDLIGSKSKK